MSVRILTQEDADFVNREVLRLAITRQMFCSECKKILDLDKAVLVRHEKAGQIAIACGDCFDKRVVEEFGQPQDEKFWDERGVELIDGRELA